MRNLLLITLWLFTNENCLAQIEMIRFYENGLAGFKNENNEVLIQPQYAQVSNFYEGYALVNYKGKRGFMNVKGEIEIPFQFEDASVFNNGLAVAKINGKYGYIDAKGNWVVEPIYEEAYPLFMKRGRVKWKDKFGFIDATGILIIPCAFENAQDFSGGFAVVKKDGRYYYITPGGKEATRERYDLAHPFRNKEAQVFIDKQWYLINTAFIILKEIDMIPEHEKERR